MEIANLKDMVKGWFVGNFDPTLFRTNDVEVAIKRYTSESHEERHHHKIATEITAIVFGRVRMNGKEYRADDIVVIPPGEATDFEALEDTVTVVVKLPGANNDKYLGESA
ncbi:MAG: hypothetical protein M0P39_05520 [Rhodocyclaceae bacterium]|nr:hypothetical protein [Rhodocyclaceae bacterium]